MLRCVSRLAAPARHSRCFDGANLISGVCAATRPESAPHPLPSFHSLALQKTELLHGQNIDVCAWSQPKGGHACIQSTGSYRICAYAHVSFFSEKNLLGCFLSYNIKSIYISLRNETMATFLRQRTQAVKYSGHTGIR